MNAGEFGRQPPWLVTREVIRMKAVLSVRSHSYGSAPRPVLYALLVLVSMGASATAQPGSPAAAPVQLVERLDSIAGAGVRENRSVGIVAAVVKGKDTLLLKAYGKSDVEGDVPMTVDTVFPIGSDTKQFTAAAILQLRDQGKLSLDDDITKWLPDFDTRGNKVTLRHLLGHTSGITDLVEMPELRAMQLMRNPTVTRDDVYKVISRYAFMFPTGTHADLQQLQLLASRPHRREGERDDLRGLHREEDLRAAGHDALDVLQQLGERPAPRLRARPEERRQAVRRVPPIVHTATYAAGAICSTAEDLITWLQALHGGKVLSPKSYAEMIDAVEAQRRDAPPLLDGTLRRARTVTVSGSSDTTAAASASPRRRGGIPTRAWRSSS